MMLHYVESQFSHGLKNVLRQKFSKMDIRIFMNHFAFRGVKVLLERKWLLGTVFSCIDHIFTKKSFGFANKSTWHNILVQNSFLILIVPHSDLWAGRGHQKSKE